MKILCENASTLGAREGLDKAGLGMRLANLVGVPLFRDCRVVACK